MTGQATREGNGRVEGRQGTEDRPELSAGAAATQTHECSQRGRGRRAQSRARTALAPQTQPYLEMRHHSLRNARARLCPAADADALPLPLRELPL